jgi:Mycotoxin biosynthesis protein UstYa
VHITHCLDILRQQLMCTVDTGVLGQVWVAQPDGPNPHGSHDGAVTTAMPVMPFVDFNTKHQCKNFDAIRKWAEVRQLPEETPSDYLEPPGTGDRIYSEIP